MNTIFIKDDEVFKQINLDEVFYFSKHNDKVVMVMKDRSEEINSTLYYINTLLSNKSNFLRSHKSYIINIDLIDRIEKYTSRTFDVKFIGTKHYAYITGKNLKVLLQKSKSL